MKTLSLEELRKLIEVEGNHSVSIYMPTQRTGDIEQNPIRLKNLLKDAEEKLAQSGMRSSEARKLLEPAQKLLDDMNFWQHQSSGLALFISGDAFRYYRAPYSFDELVVVSDRFHTKPLLPFFNENVLFYVLALSQNMVKLLQCTFYDYRDVTPKGVPRNIDEALKYDDPEKQHQYHTTGPGGVTISHGHGVSKDYDKVNISRYFHKIADGLHNVLKEERAPLILAAVDYLHAIYREANSYSNLIEEGLEGNPDNLNDEELKEQARPIAQRYFEQMRSDDFERLDAAFAKAMATKDIKEAVPAAYDGRISTLFVAEGCQQWGKFDKGKREVITYKDSIPGAEDLLDFAATYTLKNGGTVYALESDQMPTDSRIAAIFRY